MRWCFRWTPCLAGIITWSTGGGRLGWTCGPFLACNIAHWRTGGNSLGCFVRFCRCLLCSVLWCFREWHNYQDWMLWCCSWKNFSMRRDWKDWGSSVTPDRQLKKPYSWNSPWNWWHYYWSSSLWSWNPTRWHCRAWQATYRKNCQTVARFLCSWRCWGRQRHCSLINQWHSTHSEFCCLCLIFTLQSIIN